MIRRCLCVLTLLSMHAVPALAAAAALAAAPPPASPARYSAWRADAAQALIGKGDAHSLAAAAVLTFAAAQAKGAGDPAPGRSAVDLAARASELDPRDPGIAWLRLELCAATPGCDIRDAAMTLRWIDADNGAVWLPTLAAAQRDRDMVEIDRVLQDMARGSRFDFYWNRTVVLLFDTLRRARGELPGRYLPSDLARLSEAMLLAGAEIIPPISPLAAACRESGAGIERGETVSGAAERRESCLRLARLMQRADTIGAQMAGFNLEKRLASPESREAHALAERRRILEWRLTAARQSDTPTLPWLGNALARGRIAAMRAAPREEDADIALLRTRKLPLEPPDAPR
jgi:hypothetical protein